MQYRIEDHRIVAYDTNHPFIGELTFPAVPGENKRVVVEHTFVDPKFRGQGVAQALVQHFVDYATKQDYTVKLMCPFAVAQFKQHPQYQQLLLPADRF